LNVDLGDHVVLLYNAPDDDGTPNLQAYSVAADENKDELLFTINYGDVEPFLNAPPEQNTLIMQQGKIAFYALNSGGFQFNIGPDSQGKEWAVIVDTLPARMVYGNEVDAN
jgi:hypothetical protein